MTSSGDVGLLTSAGVVSSSTSSFSPASSQQQQQLSNSKTMLINPNSTAAAPVGDPQNATVEPSNVKWTKINDAATSNSIQPRPRHGHRAVAYGNYMIVFGGGNEGIVEELHVFDTTTHEWFQPQMKGDIPPGCAAYGLVLDGCRMLLYGGMIEYGRYSSDLYELNIPKWEWKKLKPKGPRNGETPCARLGHSFTIIRDQVYLFGGLANDSDDLKNNIPRYLNDMYTLQVRLNNEHGIWEVPVTFGSPPGPRESHTAVAYVSKDGRFNKLIIYGGMSGCRLGDLYILDVDTLMWCKPDVGGATPSPRSLHTATLVGEKMYVFGGWVPMLVEELKNSEKEWKCTNSLACLNVETLTWENLHQDILDDKVPRARAGHSAVVVNTRIYIWSGRDGYRKAWNNQVCCKDLWQLEVQKPGDPGKVQLLRAGTNWLEVGWNPVAGADSYILQCVAYDVPSDPIFQTEQNVHQPPQQSLGASGYTPTPPIMTPVPTSKPAKSAVPAVQIKTEPLPTTPSGSPTPVSTQGLSGLATMAATSSQSVPSSIVSSAMIQVSPSVVSQSLAISQGGVQVSPITQQQQSTESPSTSMITLSMPSLAPSTGANEPGTAGTVVSSTSVSPAVLPSASSLYTLPANVAGTVSSLFGSKAVARPVSAPAVSSASPNSGRGVLRLRTPVQVGQQRNTGTVVTSLPSGVTVLKPPAGNILSSSASDSAQLSGMHSLAAAAAAAQKIQTSSQTVKVVQQSPGQTINFSQIKVANMSNVMQQTVRVGSPVTSTGKPGGTVTTQSAGNVKQIIVQKPGAPGSGNQIYTVVKTSQGMALANIQGTKVMQGKPGGVTTASVVSGSSIQGSPQKAPNIIKWVAAPGTSVAPGSKPNIIATNQPIIGITGQGGAGMSAAGSPRPTYIISKPSTSIGGQNRPQGAQYVVVTQASAIRSIQGMAANSMAGNQTITIPTSGAPGQPGVKMIVMPSGSGAGGAGQQVKIITPSGVQTASTSKTMTLGSKPAQYITPSGQIVTLPPGLLQGNQQQISIGGKQVTLQMASGQKLAILANSAGQFVQTSTSSADGGKPKLVMVGQKTTLPASNPMRCAVSVGGVLPPDSTTDGINAVAEGMVEMASGGGGDSSEQNGVDGEGGLKGGSIYGPWSSFCFSGLEWMKLKGGVEDHDYFYDYHRDSTIPIYSASTKFSWREKLRLGLRGGAEGDGEAAAAAQATQDSSAASAAEVAESLAAVVETTTEVEAIQEEPVSNIVVENMPNEVTSTIEENTHNEVPMAEPATDTSDSCSVPTSSIETPVQQMETEDADNSTFVELQPATDVPPTEAEANAVLVAPPDQEIPLEGAQVPTSSTVVEQMDVSEGDNAGISQPAPEVNAIPEVGESSNQTTSEAVPVAVSSNETPMETSQQIKVEPSVLPVVASQEASEIQAAAETLTQLTPVPLLEPQALPPIKREVITPPPPQEALTTAQLVAQMPLPTLPQPVPSQPQQSATQSTAPTTTQAPPPPVSASLAPSLVIPTATSATTNSGTPTVVTNLPPGVYPVGATRSILTPPPAMSTSNQSTTSGNVAPPPIVSISNPSILPSGIPATIGPNGSITMQPPISAAGNASPKVAIPNAPVIRPQADTRLAQPAASQSPILLTSSATNGAPAAAAPPTPVQVKLPAPVAPEEKIDNWMDVIHTKNTSTIVRCYFTTNEKLSRLEPDIPVDKDLEFIKKKVELKPATAYKFRVAAINSCGRGPWGEVTAFKTCLPGFPGAPSSIKISKSIDGATIAWEPPLNTPGDILEYSVYLAVKPPANAPEPKPGVTNLSFVRVYCGPSNQCNVPTISLNQALVDTTSKPAIIFRIAAKNDKGYGPATQVRWLQESALPNFAASKTGILKRSAAFSTSVNAKRGRTDGN